VSLKPLEDYAYALKTTITSNSAATLTAIQTEAADSITLDNFADVEVGYNNVFNQRRYPVCFIYPADVRYENSAMSAELVTMRFEIWYAVTHKVTDTLTKKLMRYAAALRTIIFENNPLGGEVIDAVTQEAEFWPGGPDNAGIAAGKVVVSLVSELRN